MSNTLMEGCFGVFVTALIMTCFEVIFMFYIVFPGLHKSIDKLVKRSGVMLSDKICDSVGFKRPDYKKIEDSIEDKVPVEMIPFLAAAKQKGLDELNATAKNFDAALAAVEHTESKRIRQINDFVKITGALLVILLSAATTSIGMQVEDVGTPIISAMMTVGVLIPFQVGFYFLGQQYKFERNDVILTKIRKSLKNCK